MWLQPFELMLQAFPVLAMIGVIMMLPLLSERPPGSENRKPQMRPVPAKPASASVPSIPRAPYREAA